MNILIIMDPGIPVPPQKYGGIERIVYLLANAYQASGHTVTLLAGPESTCNGRTLQYGKNDLNRSKFDICKEVLFVWKHLITNALGFNTSMARGRKYDVIHNFGRLLYLIPMLHSKAFKMMSYQRFITKRNIQLINLLKPRQLCFTACSSHCRLFTWNALEEANHNGISATKFGNWTTIYNAVDFSRYDPSYTFQEHAPLIFLGRIERIKGVHTAIQVAKATNRKLWIAGNVPDNKEASAYFKDEIAKHIDDVQIIYLGALDDFQKNHYLSRSAALLFPIAWDEPFGIVMIEAMACGTPSIAFNKGAVPEVVTCGETGFIVNDPKEMSFAIQKLAQIDRFHCRYHAMSRFDIRVIANQYLNLIPD